MPTKPLTNTVSPSRISREAAKGERILPACLFSASGRAGDLLLGFLGRNDNVHQAALHARSALDGAVFS